MNVFSCIKSESFKLTPDKLGSLWVLEVKHAAHRFCLHWWTVLLPYDDLWLTFLFTSASLCCCFSGCVCTCRRTLVCGRSAVCTLQLQIKPETLLLHKKNNNCMNPCWTSKEILWPTEVVLFVFTRICRNANSNTTGGVIRFCGWAPTAGKLSLP